MGTLEEELQNIHDARIGVSITWLWDGGVDLRLVHKGGAVADEGSVENVGDVLPWLESAIKEHIRKANYGRGYQTAAGKLQVELQKIYNSEINIEISWTGEGPVAVKLGNEFYGFDAEGAVSKISDVLLWLQKAIHQHHPESKYNVERRGGKWTQKWFGSRDYTVNGEPITDGGAQ
jgi:hypothetical protein